MNVKSTAGQLGERRVALRIIVLFRSPARVGRWSVSDFAALTKPRVMMLAVFTALVGLGGAPARLDP